jgi:RNA polymerase sigma-54 factor
MLWLENRSEANAHIILTTRLLMLNAAQLEAAIAAELAENPALEQAPALRCPRCGRVVQRPPCPHCLARLTGRSTFAGDRRAIRRADDDETPSPEEYLAQPANLAEYVLAQIGPQLDAAGRVIAADVLGNLDERGYYADVPECAARRLAVPVARVHAALRAVQGAEPAGIGARDARECLLLQCAHLRAQSPAPALDCAERLVRRAWGAILHGDLCAAARQTRCDVAAVQAGLAFLRANLTPYPALTRWEPAGRAADGDTFTRPDAVVFVRDDGDFGFELLTPGPEWLSVNPLFRQAAGDDPRTAENLQALVERASTFIKCLGQRETAFARLIGALLREQRDYFLYGDRSLRPLTRAHMSGVLGVHESTISRAVSDKILSIPSGRLVPLAHLFDGSAAAKDALAELIAHESEPLTDDELTCRMSALGFPLARRTVAKYRTAIGIPPAHLRSRQTVKRSARRRPEALLSGVPL